MARALKKHGGVRKGSGRPKMHDENLVRLQANIRQSTKTRIEILASVDKVSASVYIDRLLTAHVAHVARVNVGRTKR